MPPENPDMETKPVERELPVARLARPPRARWFVRTALLGIAAALAVVFGLACYLNPYGPDGAPRSMATHTQLGLPPCNFVVMTGKPCPSCGMTTSFALLVRGDVGASARANWVGTALAVFWAGLLVWAVASGLTGRLLFIPHRRGELVLTVVVGAFLVLMLGRWVGILLGG
ncbi:MAG: hypothetical protein JWO38_107 [Gemmataceae bacterium]|nr:hypothetical protein [Gemmataceae bacterium]